MIFFGLIAIYLLVILALMLAFKHSPRLLLIPIALVILPILIVIAIFVAPQIITRTNIGYYLADSSILKGSQTIYRFHPDPGYGIGNDSTLFSIVKISNSATLKLEHTVVVFKGCSQPHTKCTQASTWRPRAEFINPDGRNFQDSELYGQTSVLQTYHKITLRKDTICTGRDLLDSYNGRPIELAPNRELICLSPSTNLLSLEYIADSDGNILH